jgi:hypothetical protein
MYFVAYVIVTRDDPAVFVGRGHSIATLSKPITDNEDIDWFYEYVQSKARPDQIAVITCLTFLHSVAEDKGEEE